MGRLSGIIFHFLWIIPKPFSTQASVYAPTVMPKREQTSSKIYYQTHKQECFKGSGLAALTAFTGQSAANLPGIQLR